MTKTTRRFLALMMFGVLLAGGVKTATPARAMPLADVIAAIKDSGGRYRWASASLSAADCSGLVSVAQSLATGQPVHRLGDTRSFLAGSWPNIIRGAMPGDSFVIAANRSHMVAEIDGVSIESTTAGQPYRVGPSAASVWDAQFPVRGHVDPGLLIA